jgi:hypothetical protein
MSVTLTKKPKKMDYDTQAIVYIAADLKDNADTLQGKRVAAGDKTANYGGDIGSVEVSAVFHGPLLTKLPIVYCQENSRLIILGHGDEDSTIISTAEDGGLCFTPEQLAGKVDQWLGANRIKRISLHMCYGGGNRGTATGTEANREFYKGFKVLPNKSFAFTFASMVGGLCESVTARTEGTNMHRTVNSAKVVMNAERLVDGRHKGFGDKYVFITDGGTVDHPVNPRVLPA